MGVYHSLNKFITLVGEFNNEKINNVTDSNFDNKNRTVSVGGLIFFDGCTWSHARKPAPLAARAPSGRAGASILLVGLVKLALSPVLRPAGQRRRRHRQRVVPRGTFQAVREALIDSIEEEGLVVSAVIPFNDMLQRTAAASARRPLTSPFLRAEIVQFCSSRIAWQLLAGRQPRSPLCPFPSPSSRPRCARRSAPGVAAGASRRRCPGALPPTRLVERLDAPGQGR